MCDCGINLHHSFFFNINYVYTYIFCKFLKLTPLNFINYVYTSKNARLWMVGHFCMQHVNGGVGVSS